MSNVLENGYKIPSLWLRRIPRRVALIAAAEAAAGAAAIEIFGGEKTAPPEKESFLGTIPSGISPDGWRVRYLEQGDSIFEPSELPPVTTYPHDSIVCGFPPKVADISMSYKKTPQGVVPALLIQRPGGPELVILANPTEGADTSAVEFLNIRTQDKFYASFERYQSYNSDKYPIFQVQEMVKK